jgi:hypothetical protein
MNDGIRAAIVNPADPGGWASFQVQLSCTVADLGVVGCAAGLAEFYVGDQFSVWNPGHEGLTAVQVKANAQRVGYAPFQVSPGGTATLTCRKLWTPGSAAAARKGVLVQVYDFFTDRLTAPFDAVNDRHVARNDQAVGSMVVSQGATTLKGTFLFDLDAGTQSLPGVIPPGADVWWEQMTATQRQMMPRNGAAIVNLGAADFGALTAPGLQALAYAATPIPGNDDATNQLVTGDVFAVRTAEGNYAKVLVVAYGYNMEIQWVTYAPPP